MGKVPGQLDHSLRIPVMTGAMYAHLLFMTREDASIILLRYGRLYYRLMNNNQIDIVQAVSSWRRAFHDLSEGADYAIRRRR